MIKLETHCHTAESSTCATRGAHEAVAELVQHGYGAVIITDHVVAAYDYTSPTRWQRFLRGYYAAREAALPHGITVLPAMEIRFEEGPEDYLVLGMEEEDILALPAGLCECGRVAFRAYADAHGLLIYQAHPFRNHMTPMTPDIVHGIEVYNGCVRHNSRNGEALAYARTHNLLQLSGSDAHQPGDEGTGGIFVPGEVLTPKGLVAYLRETRAPEMVRA